MDVRRMIGVGAFCYAAAHISLYVIDQAFDLLKVGSEIVLRLYLTIGFTALVGLALLAVTSTDDLVRRLGASRWQRLHRLIYGIVLLALIHFFQQTKADVWVPTFFAGVVCWLLGYRFLIALGRRPAEPSTAALIALAGAVAVITFLGEAIGIGIAYSVSPLAVLQMAFDFDLDAIRPGWLVLGAGLCMVALGVGRSWWRKPRSRAGTPTTTRSKPMRETA
jgi:sulfoxide reductase heme-binding subunit YedZ